MSSETTSSKDPLSRAPDSRFKGGSTTHDKLATIRKIDITPLQLDESFEGDGDPYNSTGRHLVAAIRNRNRG